MVACADFITERTKTCTEIKFVGRQVFSSLQQGWDSLKSLLNKVKKGLHFKIPHNLSHIIATYLSGLMVSSGNKWDVTHSAVVKTH